MRKHVIFIAAVHLAVGILVGALFLYGHYQFFSIGSTLFPENPVLASRSFFERLGDFYNVYMNFFALFGINPLISLVTVIASIAFGYGLLKTKEWARKLGLAIIVVSTASSLYGIFTGSISGAGILQIALAAYMWWVLTAAETKTRFKTGAVTDSLS